MILAFALLLVLKLAHVIAWSWWIVCSPLLVGVGLWLLAFALGLGFFGAVSLLGRKITR